ncbi:hypothetical protein BDZ91DRAFT_827296 [Kalaharituber pfeilii]|nr:hypothetical protein BDZ91DRAFT_827296 [Kalaharituber pfeilii]
MNVRGEGVGCQIGCRIGYRRREWGWGGRCSRRDVEATEGRGVLARWQRGCRHGGERGDERGCWQGCRSGDGEVIGEHIIGLWGKGGWRGYSSGCWGRGATEKRWAAGVGAFERHRDGGMQRSRRRRQSCHGASVVPPKRSLKEVPKAVEEGVHSELVVEPGRSTVGGGRGVGGVGFAY